MLALLLTLALAGEGQSASTAAPSAEHEWMAGDHMTGEWGGARGWLGERGLQVDLAYTGELFSNVGQTFVTDRGAIDYLGHVDLQLTFDTSKLLWSGGKFVVLAQAQHGSGINARYVGATQTTTNLEADYQAMVTELFYEHTLLDDRLLFRLGKQDHNRDFGSPRYGGNFINDGYGALPLVPAPTYPTTGLGAFGQLQVVPALTLKAGVYEGQPVIGGLGVRSALQDGGGFTTVAGAALKHTLGEAGRNGGTTQVGGWFQRATLPQDSPSQLAPSPTARGGLFLVHDQHLYRDPANEKDGSGLTVVVRFAVTPKDEADPWLYTGVNVAWHGLGPEQNDTVGVGYGTVTYAHALPGQPTTELNLELFYKARLTRWLSLEPDLQYVLHPGGRATDAVVGGLRFKFKL